MKKIQILLLLSFSLLFTACGQREPQKVLFKDRFICFDFIKADETQEVEIRVHDEDLTVFAARNDELKKNIKYYESQIDRHNSYCAEIIGDKNGKIQ